MPITNLNTHAASYVSVAELATYWDVTRQLVYKHIQSGSLPAIRLGPRCFRVRTTDAVDFERSLSSRSGNGGGRNGSPRAGAMQLVRHGRRWRTPPETRVNQAKQKTEAHDGTGD